MCDNLESLHIATSGSK